MDAISPAPRTHRKLSRSLPLLALFAWLTALGSSANAALTQAGGRHLGVKLLRLRDAAPEEEQRIKSALSLAERALNSEEFKQKLMSHVYDGKQQFANNNGLSNEEIYETIMSGRETLTGQEDSLMDLDLTLYTSSWWQRGTVGYTYPDSLEIFMNRRHYSNFTLAEIAGNVVHEWTHKLGFEHDFRATPQRPYSVPYAVGEIIVELIEDTLCPKCSIEDIP